MFRCLHAYIRHASIREFLQASYQQFETYGGSIGIEENMLKDFLKYTLQSYAKEVRKTLPWQTVHHSGNKITRIIGDLSYLVEFGQILFERNQSDQNLLVQQLIYLLNPNIHDDGPDALQGAVRLLQGQGGKAGEFKSTGKQRVHASMENF